MKSRYIFTSIDEIKSGINDWNRLNYGEKKDLLKNCILQKDIHLLHELLKKFTPAQIEIILNGRDQSGKFPLLYAIDVDWKQGLDYLLKMPGINTELTYNTDNYKQYARSQYIKDKINSSLYTRYLLENIKSNNTFSIYQSILINFSKRLGFPDCEGICLGYAGLAAMSFLQPISPGQDRLAAFKKRIQKLLEKSIEQHLDNLKTTQDKLKIDPNATLTEDEEFILSMPAFLDGLQLFQHSGLFPHLYPIFDNLQSGLSEQQMLIERALPLLRTKALEEANQTIESIHRISGMYTLDELETYFKAFHATASRHALPIAFSIGIRSHEIAVMFDPTRDEFNIVNADEDFITIRMTPETFSQSIKQIANEVKTACSAEFKDDHLPLATTMLINSSDMAKKDSFIADWTSLTASIHEVTPKKYELNSEDDRWYHVADFAGDVEILDKLYKKDDGTVSGKLSNMEKRIKETQEICIMRSMKKISLTFEDMKKLDDYFITQGHITYYANIFNDIKVASEFKSHLREIAHMPEKTPIAFEIIQNKLVLDAPELIIKQLNEILSQHTLTNEFGHDDQPFNLATSDFDFSLAANDFTFFNSPQKGSSSPHFADLPINDFPAFIDDEDPDSTDNIAEFPNSEFNKRQKK